MTAFARALLVALILITPCPILAAEAETSVQANIRNMDKDSDGSVTVFEVRAMIEAKHGKNYKKDALDRLESTAYGISCTTPFAKSMY